MNKSSFITLLEELDKSTWQAIIDGQALSIVGDASLKLCSSDSLNIVIHHTSNLDAISLRSHALNQAEELLENYYRKHPLNQKGFSSQAIASIDNHGAEAFAAKLGSFPERTLFVDGGELIAESQDSPHHQYGAFCELESTIKQPEITARVENWIESGTAYERYLEMNVCRYSC